MRNFNAGLVNGILGGAVTLIDLRVACLVQAMVNENLRTRMKEIRRCRQQTIESIDE